MLMSPLHSQSGTRHIQARWRALLCFLALLGVHGELPDSEAQYVALHQAYPIRSFKDLKGAVRNLYSVSSATGRVVILPAVPCSLPWVQAHTDIHPTQWTVLISGNQGNEGSLCEWKPDCPDAPVKVQTAALLSDLLASRAAAGGLLSHMSRSLLDDYGGDEDEGGLGLGLGRQGAAGGGGDGAGGGKRRRRRRRRAGGAGQGGPGGGHGGAGEGQGGGERGMVREGKVRRRRRRRPESLKLNSDDLYKRKRGLMATSHTINQKQQEGENQVLFLQSPIHDLALEMLDMCQDLDLI